MSELTDQLLEYIDAIEHAEDFLREGSIESMNMSSIYNKIHETWLKTLKEQNEALYDDSSLPESLFLGLCTIKCVKTPQLQEKQSIDDLYNILINLVNEYSQHKVNFMKSYNIEGFHNNSSEWSVLIPYLIEYFNYGTLPIEMYFKNDKKMILFDDKINLKPEVYEKWKKLQLTIKKESEADDLKRRDDVINRGYMYRSYVEECCRHFIPISCRIAGQIEIERLLLMKYPLIHEQIEFHPNCKQRLHQLLSDISRIEPDEKFNNDFREFILEHNLPLGCRTRSKRKLATASNKYTAQTLLIQELGVDIAQDLVVEINNIRFDLICSDLQNPFFYYYILCRFNHWFFHKVRMNWLEQFYILPTNLIYESFKFDKLNADSSGLFKLKRSPLITRLGGQFMIHDQTNFYYCQDTFQLILTWFWLLKCNHDSKTSNRTSCDMVIKHLDLRLFHT